MKLIESKTLVSAQASIEFTSIPADFTDLLFLASLRADSGSTNDTTFLINGSAPTGRILTGNGSSAASNALFLAVSNGSANTANTFSNISLYIPNYTSAANKSLSLDSVFETNATTAFQVIGAGLWSNTAAITTVRFSPEAATNYVAGTTISLYGILKGSDGIVTTS